jgi:hypothetical protein
MLVYFYLDNNKQVTLQCSNIFNYQHDRTDYLFREKKIRVSTQQEQTIVEIFAFLGIA